MTPAFNVLFLCTRNSARSIMAEAILNRFAGERFHAYSAGSDPAAAPMPDVIEKLHAVGHDVSGLHSKSWHLFTGPDAPQLDFVIGLCDVMDRQHLSRFRRQGGDGLLVDAGPGKIHAARASSARRC